MGCETPGGLQPGPDEVAYHTVNRRYSEFLNLQTRLEEKAELRRLIKGKPISSPRRAPELRLQTCLRFLFQV